MRVYRDGNKWIYEHANLINLVPGRRSIIQPGRWKLNSSYPAIFATTVTLGSDTVSLGDDQFYSLSNWLNDNKPGWDEPVDIEYEAEQTNQDGKLPKIALYFMCERKSSTLYEIKACFGCGWGSGSDLLMLYDDYVNFRAGEWHCDRAPHGEPAPQPEGWATNNDAGGIGSFAGSYRVLETFNADTVAEAYEIWGEYADAIDARVRFPRWFERERIYGLAPYTYPEYTNVMTWLHNGAGWEEEDIPVDTSWRHPKSKLRSIHAWKLTDASELNYQKSLWSMDTDDTKISKSLYANPMDCIIAENFIPFAFPSDQLSAREQAILVGIQELSYNGEQVKAYFLTDEYHEIEFGSVVIPRTFNDYRDFTETSIQLFLPCIGWKALDAQTYMGKELIIKYRLDFVTGDILALLITNPGSVIQDTMKGNCLSSIPISGRDFTSVLQARLAQQNAMITAVGGFVGGAASGLVGIATGNPVLAVGGAATALGSVTSGLQSGKAAQIQATKAENNVVKDGNLGGANAVLGYSKAYIVISRHADAMPTRYQNYEGYQTNKILTISNLTGYIKAREVYFSSARATEEEKAMIENGLKKGVFK